MLHPWFKFGFNTYNLFFFNRVSTNLFKSICWIQFQSRITLDKFSSEHVDYILVPKLIFSLYIELIIMQNYGFLKDYDLMQYTYHVLNERETCIITFVMWTQANIVILTLENDWNCATDGILFFQDFDRSLPFKLLNVHTTWLSNLSSDFTLY
jgi:hypothetical protein